MPEFMNFENIYWTIALFSTVIFIIKLAIFTIVGGDMELDADFTDISEVDTAFEFFSVQSILAFLMGFGWCGWTSLTQFNTNWILTLIIGIVFGFLCMTFSAWIMFAIKKLAKKVVVDYNELVNKTGKTYSVFEPKGEGRIEIVLNDKLTILNAISLSEEKIESFSEIKVEKVEGNKIYINKI